MSTFICNNMSPTFTETQIVAQGDAIAVAQADGFARAVANIAVECALSTPSPPPYCKAQSPAICVNVKAGGIRGPLCSHGTVIYPIHASAPCIDHAAAEVESCRSVVLSLAAERPAPLTPARGSP